MFVGEMSTVEAPGGLFHSTFLLLHLVGGVEARSNVGVATSGGTTRVIVPCRLCRELGVAGAVARWWPEWRLANFPARMQMSRAECRVLLERNAKLYCSITKNRNPSGKICQQPFIFVAAWRV